MLAPNPNPAHEAAIQRQVDARCLEQQLTWMRRTPWLVPMELLWLLLGHQAGMPLPALAAWGAARLLLHGPPVLMARRLAPLVASDPARGLRRTRAVYAAFGALHAVMMAWILFRGDDTTRLLASLLTVSYSATVVISAAGQPLTYWVTTGGSMAVMLAGWAWRGGPLGWTIVVMLLASLPMTAVSIRQPRRAWESLVRLADENERLVASLAAERDRSQAAAATRTRFFAAASHDLRQPLHALSINATTLALLARRAGDAELGELSEGIGRALAQSQGLLDALLDISRLDAGAVKLVLAEHDVAAIVGQLHAEFAALAAQRGLDFVLDVAGDPAWARTDADQLRRVLRNLLDNAFKFTERGRVRLSLARRGGDLCVQVADSGCGIAAAEREKVFEEFYQVGNPARDRGRGLGLGLAIVRRTATLIGARVQLIESEAGVGARFEVALPALASPPRATVVVEAARREALPPQTVLLVDDESDILQAMSGLLRAVGWQAQGAGSVQEALALAAESGRTFTAAVVDHRLPDGNGIDLVRRLRELRPGLPALVVTGDVAVQWDVRRHGLRVLHKPLDGAALAAAVAEEVTAGARWQARRDAFRLPGGEEPMNIIDAIHGRRSVRQFRAEPVPRDLVEDLIWHASQVPLPPVSGEHSWAFCVAEGAARLAALGERAKRYAAEHQPPGEPWTWPARSDFEVFWGAPTLVLICARHGHPEAPFDCCRAGQNLSLLAHARGLGSCWVGAPIPWLASEEGRAALDLPTGFDPSVAIVLGHPEAPVQGQSRPRPAVRWCGPAPG